MVRFQHYFDRPNVNDGVISRGCGQGIIILHNNYYSPDYSISWIAPAYDDDRMILTNYYDSQMYNNRDSSCMHAHHCKIRRAHLKFQRPS